MKFQIWCTRHDSSVISASDDFVLKSFPVRPTDAPDYEIDEGDLYCMIGGDAIMIDPPGKIVP